MSSPNGRARDPSVGYGRPPVASRFQKGKSGNPRGRSPGRKNYKTELLDELSQKIAVTDNGRRRKMSNQTVIIKRLVADAAKGVPKARDQLLRQMDKIEGDAPAVPPPIKKSESDEEREERFRGFITKVLKLGFRAIAVSMTPEKLIEARRKFILEDAQRENPGSPVDETDQVEDGDEEDDFDPGEDGANEDGLP